MYTKIVHNRRKRAILCTLSLLFLITACGEIDNAKGGAASPIEIGSLYKIQPNIETCFAGELQESAKQEALQVVNTIRRLHGLETVTYDYASDEGVMNASLMMAANNKISHSFSASEACYTETGNVAAGSSNVGLSSGNHAFRPIETGIIGFMTEVNNIKSKNIGHRRWLLDPFLKQIAYGRVAQRLGNNTSMDGSAMKVRYPSIVATASTSMAKNAIIAYPYHDYPAKYFDRQSPLSLSILADPGNWLKNQNVDFSMVQVIVTSNGIPVTITDLSYGTNGYGLPNSLQFLITDIHYNQTYDVALQNVKINGVLTDLLYWFNVVE
jgi:uncharacterized protein YkwD